MFLLSPPSRWCGLKLTINALAAADQVTTFAVVWIEIYNGYRDSGIFGSPPSRWCGLKYTIEELRCEANAVTTFAVVWIEIIYTLTDPLLYARHHLRGGVD